MALNVRKMGVEMLKIFVTGDNHIGLKYASHEQAAILASSRVAAFEGMVQKANQDFCDLFVITGDLFENTYSVIACMLKSGIQQLLSAHSTRFCRYCGRTESVLVARTQRVRSYRPLHDRTLSATS